jgi:hypothetical protein
MVVKFTVFENILHQLGDKQTVAFSTVAKQHKISFFVGLLTVPKQPFNLAQKLEVIRIVIFSAAFFVDRTLQFKQLRHSTLPDYCFLLLGFDNL